MKNEDKKWAVGMLFIGIILGVSGNIVASILDRHFLQYGLKYEFIASVLFFGSIIYIDKKFTKLLDK